MLARGGRCSSSDLQREQSSRFAALRSRSSGFWPLRLPDFSRISRSIPPPIEPKPRESSTTRSRCFRHRDHGDHRKTAAESSWILLPFSAVSVVSVSKTAAPKKVARAEERKKISPKNFSLEGKYFSGEKIIASDSCAFY